MFANPFPKAFGLDIGDLSIKLVQLKNVSSRYRKPVFEFVHARSTKLPPGLIVNGEIQSPEKLRKYVLHLLDGVKGKQKPIKSPWAVVSLPEVQSFISLITVAKSPADVIEDDILAAAQKHIPFNQDDYYLDWQIVPAHADQETATVLVGASPRRITDAYTYLFESLGLGVIALEIEGLAIARAMITAGKEYGDEARAILDLGAARSSLIIYDHDAIQLSMSLPFSGEIINTLLVQKHGLSYEDAEKKKQEIGLDFSQKDNVMWATLMEAAEQLTKHVQNALHYYYTHGRAPNKITHITMCGGGSLLKGLPEVLTEKLNIEAKPGRVFKNLSSKKKIPVSSEAGLSYATAIGLALRAADNPFLLHDVV